MKSDLGSQQAINFRNTFEDTGTNPLAYTCEFRELLLGFPCEIVLWLAILSIIETAKQGPWESIRSIFLATSKVSALWGRLRDIWGGEEKITWVSRTKLKDYTNHAQNKIINLQNDFLDFSVSPIYMYNNTFHRSYWRVDKSKLTEFNCWLACNVINIHIGTFWL